MILSEQIIETGPGSEATAEDAINWRTRLAQYLQISTLLRLSGSGFTVMAILLFLFQRWDDATDLLRYGRILGETLLLTALGLVTSRWLKEQKSARVFLALSLVSTTAVFTVLAAMIHSQVQWMPEVAVLPDFAIWATDSMETVMLLLGGSFILLGGQSLLSLSVLARPVSRRLGMLMMLNLTLLLLPVRDMGMTTLMVLPALFFGSHYLSMLRRSTPAMRTLEGALASILVMLPLVIMIGRGAYFYAQGPVAVGSLAMLTYLVLRQLALSMQTLPQWRRLLELASLLPALLSAEEFTRVIQHLSPGAEHWLALVFGVFTAGFLLDLTRRAASGRIHYLRGIFYTGLAVAVLEQALWPGVSTAMLAVPLSGLVVLYNYGARDTHLLRASLLVLIGSLALLVSQVVGTLNVGSWMGMALLGMSTIVLAAAVERYGKEIMGMIERLKS
jgi:hypothetical protein